MTADGLGGGEKTVIKDRIHYITELECGPMPNVMDALPNITLLNATKFG